MSHMLAIVLWIAIGIGIRVGFMAYDPDYRDACGKYNGIPGLRGFSMVRQFPLYELGWYLIMGALFVVYLIVLTP